MYSYNNMEFNYAMGIVFIKSFSILKWLPTGRSMLRFKSIGGHEYALSVKMCFVLLKNVTFTSQTNARENTITTSSISIS